MPNTLFNAYEWLEIKPTASDAEIKKAFKIKAHDFHPDKFNNSQPANVLFKMLVRAKDILLDPQKRLQHDYAMGIKTKPIIQPNPKIIYIKEKEREPHWASIISAGLLGLAVGSALHKRKNRKRK